jgi:hypothetical protein
MREGVISYVVPLGENALNEFGIGLGVLADDEEGCVNILGFQDVEDFRCPFGVGTVVEREGDLMGHVSGALDDERGRKGLVRFGSNFAARRIHPECSRALYGFFRDI